jgi:hypothetical protein
MPDPQYSAVTMNHPTVTNVHSHARLNRSPYLGGEKYMNADDANSTITKMTTKSIRPLLYAEYTVLMMRL